ncbi:FkbM family methyltransferase [Reichenbachiella sp. MALMAid0571]|uniref:FkbM family methyltransferase n=1 Tax=Reichenbachiella sp. MALMAid0571 TaxID=3143939 RepID=UPI0032E033F2
MNGLKRVIKQIPVLNDVAMWCYSRFILPQGSSAYWINRLMRDDDLSVVQIGSNDGKTGDPLHQAIMKNKNWKVLFVEPVPYLFNKLKFTYPSDLRFVFENAAINDGVKQTFYTVDPEVGRYLPNLPLWVNGISSFNKNHIIKHLDGILEPYIAELEIESLSLKELFLKHKIEKLDILHIDAEGYDWKILSQLNLERYHPSIILFEFKHLTFSDQEESVHFLSKYYHIFQIKVNYLCIRKSENRLTEKDLAMLKSKFYIKPGTKM